MGATMSAAMYPEPGLPAARPAAPPSPSIARFLAETLEPEKGVDRFDVVDKRFVRIDVDGFMWIKRGTLIAYHGDLRFHLERVLQDEPIHRSTGPLRSAAKREAVPLSMAEGKGRLYLSDDGKFNEIVRLTGHTIFIASPSLLAFEPVLEHEVRTVGEVGLVAGGLFMVRLSGTGLVALSVKGDPLTMRVTPGNPVSTDPAATIAWTGDLWPELKTDVELRSLVAHGGGQPIQMFFRGHGFVVVNARSRKEARRTGLISRLTSKITRLLV
jgi:uncharacterized protein (AIM24 family)